VRLIGGDCVLPCNEQAFRLCRDPKVAGGTATLNGGGEVRGLGGYFGFAGVHSAVLLALLRASGN